jgi:membrane-bound lytic murein transglycosylase D
MFARNRTALWTLQAALVVCAACKVLAAADCTPPHVRAMPSTWRYGFPPAVEKGGLTFAGSRIPLERPDVRDRILREINYLLMDRRSRVVLWLTRHDLFKDVILPTLAKYDMPQEFALLAGVESSYNPRALSSAGAYGYWQFIKSTATAGQKNSEQYDWRMAVTKWKDERADLVRSTHAAAKYLAWMNRSMKVGLEGAPEREGLGDWLLAAASYNAGPRRVLERMNLFGANSYWDTPLPIETEKYVPRLIAISLIHANRQFYGVPLEPGKGVAFETIEDITLKKDLSMSVMAKMLNMTPRSVWALNSQINPEEAEFPALSGRKPISHVIHVPKGSGKKFLAELKAKGYTAK